MLHKQEEEEPGGQGDKVLDHGPDGDIQNLSQTAPVEASDLVQSVFLQVNLLDRVDDKEQGRQHFGQRGAQRGTGDTHLRESELSEYQDVVEHHIRSHHHQRVECQRLGLGGSDKERAEHHRDKRKEETDDTVFQITQSRLTDVCGGYDGRKNVGSQNPGSREREGRQKDHEVQSLIEDVADLLIMLLSVSAGNQNLRTDAEAESDHEDGQIEDASDGRGTEFHFAHTPQKGGVGHSDQLFHDEADQNRVGHL